MEQERVYMEVIEKKLTWDFRLSNMMNNLLPLDCFIYLFLNSQKHKKLSH